MSDSNADLGGQPQYKIPEILQNIENRQEFSKAVWRVSPAGKISSKVSESLNGEGQEKITKYLDWLYGNISNSIQSIKRNAISILGLMAVFELVANSGSTVSVTIFSVGVPKHSIIPQLIPAAVAFLYLQLLRDSVDTNRSRAAFSKAFELWNEKSVHNNLDEYIWPSAPLYWSPFNKDDLRTSDNLKPAIGRIGHAFEAMFSIAFLAFLGQAYYVLFVPHLNGNFTLWAVSLFFTLFCLWAALALVFGEIALREITSTMRMFLREAKKAHQNSSMQ